MNIKESALTFALKKAIADLVAAEVGDDRKDVFESLLGLHKATGTRSLSVTLPDGEQVATVTLPKPSTSYKVDKAVFLDWLKENRPDLVETVEHPAVGAWTEEVIDPKALDKLEAGVNDGTLITPDGVEVDGVEVVNEDPKSFTVTYAKAGDGGRQTLVSAWRSGQLGSIEPGRIVPAIEQ